MATLQIRVDDNLKKEADALFAGLGLDTSTAIRIFLNAAIEHAGIPFLFSTKPILWLKQFMTAVIAAICMGLLTAPRLRWFQCWRIDGRCIKLFIPTV